MKLINWVHALGGLGVFLFSLRFLTSRLNESVSSRFRPILAKLLATQPHCLTFGILTSAIFGSSGVVTVAMMGLVDSGLINLEQAFLICLGAWLGTTFKIWFLVGPIPFGPLLIGIGSLTLLFTKHPLLREFLEIITAVGFTFLGLNMLAESVTPIQKADGMLQVLGRTAAIDLASQILVVSIGSAIASAIQSGSAVVAMVIGLTAKGGLDFHTGACLILGANLGATSTALLASLQAAPRGRRLALCILIAQLGGVTITLFLLPSFLAGIHQITTWLIPSPSDAVIQAAIHSGFNTINLLWWWALSAPLIKTVKNTLPGEAKASFGLPKGVRRLLNRSPQRAAVEINNQFKHLELLVKSLYDHVLALLTEGAHYKGLKTRRILLERNLSEIKETLHDLLFALIRHPDSKNLEPKIQAFLSAMEIYSSLARTCFAFNYHLERGLVVDNFQIPSSIKEALLPLQEVMNDLWLSILLPDRHVSPEKIKVTPLKPIENAILDEARRTGSGHQEYLSWLAEIGGFLREISRHLGDIQQLKLNVVLTDPIGPSESKQTDQISDT